MNEQTAELLNKLSEKLGVATEALWSSLMRQAPIASISNIITSLAFLVLIIVVRRWGSRLEDQEERSFVQIVTTGAFVLWLVVVSTILPSVMAGLFNPEYWALKEILRSL